MYPDTDIQWTQEKAPESRGRTPLQTPPWPPFALYAIAGFVWVFSTNIKRKKNVKHIGGLERREQISIPIKDLIPRQLATGPVNDPRQRNT